MILQHHLVARRALENRHPDQAVVAAWFVAVVEEGLVGEEDLAEPCHCLALAGTGFAGLGRTGTPLCDEFQPRTRKYEVTEVRLRCCGNAEGVAEKL
jgi:hypothetical protein